MGFWCIVIVQVRFKFLPPLFASSMTFSLFLLKLGFEIGFSGLKCESSDFVICNWWICNDISINIIQRDCLFYSNWERQSLWTTVYFVFCDVRCGRRQSDSFRIFPMKDYQAARTKELHTIKPESCISKVNPVRSCVKCGVVLLTDGICFCHLSKQTCFLREVA